MFLEHQEQLDHIVQEARTQQGKLHSDKAAAVISKSRTRNIKWRK